MSNKIIEKFLSQKCVGYNTSFTIAIYEERVQYRDGSTAIIYTQYPAPRPITPSSSVHFLSKE